MKRMAFKILSKAQHKKKNQYIKWEITKIRVILKDLDVILKTNLII
jgi:hypothetical protein